MNLAYFPESTVEIRFYYDPESGEPHILNHGVSEDEVVDILAQPDEDMLARDGAKMALGQTAEGRYLRVIYVPDPDPYSVFVITAYELRGKPLQAFKRRRKKRRGR